MKSIKYANEAGQFSISQQQAVIKLLEKIDKDKRLVKNWHPILLLNVNMKVIFKTIATKLKSVLTSLISQEQTAFVNKRSINEGSRLISDILKVCNLYDKEGYLVTIDLEIL